MKDGALVTNNTGDILTSLDDSLLEILLGCLRKRLADLLFRYKVI
jgi:hypothetical protein